MNNTTKFKLTLDNENKLQINGETIPDTVLENYGLNFTTKIVGNKEETFLTVPTNGSQAIIPSNTAYWNYLCEDILLDTIANQIPEAA